jgi:hypothetical protein
MIRHLFALVIAALVAGCPAPAGALGGLERGSSGEPLAAALPFMTADVLVSVVLAVLVAVELWQHRR